MIVKQRVWLRLNENKKAGKEEVKLDWKDYVAISIAALQTCLLPIVLLGAVLFVFSILFGIFLFH